jgi:hypothetical protein
VTDAQDPNRIVIDWNDLGSESTAAPPTMPAPTPAAGAYSPVAQPIARPPQLGQQPTPLPIAVGAYAPGGPPPGGTGKSFASTIGANQVISGLIAGGLGGLVGAIIAEPVIWWIPQSLTEEEVQVGLWLAIFSAVLGFALKSWPGFTSGSAAKGFRDGAVGLGLGAGAGLVGGLVAQFVYHLMAPNPYTSGEALEILARVVGWGIFGLLVGLGICLDGGGKRIINGLLGGLAGGALGGFLFQVILSASTSAETVVRILCMVLTGIGIGVCVGLVEHIRRDNWLHLVAGPMAGKQFILYNPETSVGRDYRCDIVLTKDPAVAPLHATFILDPRGDLWLRPAPSAPVLVNDVGPTNAPLSSGDRISIGATTILVEQRASAPQPTPAAW